MDSLGERYHSHALPNKSRIALHNIATKYQNGVSLSQLDDSEKRILVETSLNDIYSSEYPGVVWELKLQSLAEFMNSLERSLHRPYTFRPEPKMIFNLNEITHFGTEEMKTEGTRIKKLLIQTVVDSVNRKFNAETPLARLTPGEVQVLLNMRPLFDDELYPDVALKLHWKVIEDSLDKDMEKLDSDPAFEVYNVTRLIRLGADVRVPEHVRSKAQRLRLKNQDFVVQRLPRVYNLESKVDDLSKTEIAVLDRLNVILNNYHPVVEHLHWEVTYFILCEDYESFKDGNLTGKDYMPKKLEFLCTNDRVPDKIKQKAKEFRGQLLSR